jgi:hypothetical protein
MRGAKCECFGEHHNISAESAGSDNVSVSSGVISHMDGMGKKKFKKLFSA